MTDRLMMGETVSMADAAQKSNPPARCRFRLGRNNLTVEP
jgi:hypothetical protein